MNETTTQYRPGDRLTRHQAAEYLGVSLSRLAQHRRAGHINHEKNPVTLATRFVFEDVEQLRRWRDGEIAELGKVTRR
jgi:hypothetical protein